MKFSVHHGTVRLEFEGTNDEIFGVVNSYFGPGGMLAGFVSSDEGVRTDGVSDGECCVECLRSRSASQYAGGGNGDDGGSSAIASESRSGRSVPCLRYTVAEAKQNVAPRRVFGVKGSKESSVASDSTQDGNVKVLEWRQNNARASIHQGYFSQCSPETQRRLRDSRAKMLIAKNSVEELKAERLRRKLSNEALSIDSSESRSSRSRSGSVTGKLSRFGFAEVLGDSFTSKRIERQDNSVAKVAKSVETAKPRGRVALGKSDVAVDIGKRFSGTCKEAAKTFEPVLTPSMLAIMKKNDEEAAAVLSVSAELRGPVIGPIRPHGTLARDNNPEFGYSRWEY